VISIRKVEFEVSRPLKGETRLRAYPADGRLLIHGEERVFGITADLVWGPLDRPAHALGTVVLLPESLASRPRPSEWLCRVGRAGRSGRKHDSLPMNDPRVVKPVAVDAPRFCGDSGPQQTFRFISLSIFSPGTTQNPLRWSMVNPGNSQPLKKWLWLCRRPGIACIGKGLVRACRLEYPTSHAIRHQRQFEADADSTPMIRYNHSSFSHRKTPNTVLRSRVPCRVSSAPSWCPSRRPTYSLGIFSAPELSLV
jgi:hypothetical protein